MASPAQRAIALLIDMAERGEIDPWDVKVVEVIDRFFTELNLNTLIDPSQVSLLRGANYEANLSESGQAFLYASMLVLLKAETLATEAEPENSDEALPLPEQISDLSTGLPLSLEQQIRRRAVAQPPQQRPVTLPELIEQLELMAVAMESPPQRTKTRRPHPPSDRQVTQAINQLSQQENPAELADVLGEFLIDRWADLTAGQTSLDFETLVNAWIEQVSTLASPNQPESFRGVLRSASPKSHRVGLFWSLLLLSAQSKVELLQSELYRSLEIRLIPPLIPPQPDSVTEPPVHQLSLPEVLG
jgi:segregation and condensation protein A